ncbi:GIY-YIG nuclease family protein [Chloroflexota bacterium]|nr:GIY-YIG nuclease family protein [Chloroflexota bacterium]
MTNQSNRVLYTGVTNDLYRRVSEHKEGRGSSFTTRYNVNQLVYYEVYDYIDDAIEREKQIKGGSRQRKIDLIKEMNPEWRDLFDELQF